MNFASCRTALLTCLMLGGAVIGGAWVGSQIAGRPLTIDTLTNPTAPLSNQKTAMPHIPQSETGAFLMAQKAERASDWSTTHTALSYLQGVTTLPSEQVARFYLAAIAQGDWKTVHAIAQKNPEILTSSAPIVSMLYAITQWADGQEAPAQSMIRTTEYNPITQPVLPFVKGWMTRETPQLGLVEAAQDLAFSSINLVRFYEASKQYDKADALMLKLQEADLSLRLRTWSLAYFQRRGMAREAANAQVQIDAFLGAMPTTFWQQEQKRIMSDAALHLKNDRYALAITLIDATEFLSENNASAVALLYAQIANYLAPDLDAAAMTLGNIYEDQENWDDALAAYSRVSKDSPSFLIAGLRKANILGNAGRYDEAKSAFNTLGNLYAKDPEIWYEKGEFLRATLKDYNGAIAAYDKAIALFGQDIPTLYWSLYLARGLSYELTDRAEQAERDYQKALDLQPNNPEALNTLAYAWADKGKNLDQAELMVKQALQIELDAPHIIDTLGWIYFKKGDMRMALPLLEQAATMMPYDPTVNSHLGDVYDAVGRKREAVYMWQRALGAVENDKERIALESKLKR